jgi:phage shock protein A
VDAALSALNTALDRSGQTADAALHEVEELRVQLALARSEVSNLEQRVAELRREMYQMERQVADRDALIIARDREIAILRGVA